MELSSIMSGQLADLRRTLNVNLLKSQVATQTAFVTAMIQQMPATADQGAPHPYKGAALDVFV
ncbi:hypothetical protein [Domibacillus epiphyticus]|uniref:Motility protein n=1 Tax=Domibacillus epiphyticus TaxID=1714355 RepID=A0A1V2A8S7_9BACI|nr:hypothetical protein [Domibacillus epiphyticus]OMP67398.1 hypothetical protein BTO28_05480 [Domibacillus epiphyticus]